MVLLLTPEEVLVLKELSCCISIWATSERLPSFLVILNVLNLKKDYFNEFSIKMKSCFAKKKQMLETLLEGNPYFSAGAGIIGLTAVSGFLLKGVGHLAFLAKRRMLVSLEIPIKDQSYPWFLDWMSNQRDVSGKSRIGKLLNKQLHQLSVETNFSRHPNGSVQANFSLIPGQGKHFFEWKGAIFQVERSRSATNVNKNAL